MELFGLGWILRHFGYFGSLAWLFVMAACGAILGLRYAKHNDTLPNKDPQISINIIKFALFLWVTWLLTFGVQCWMFYGFDWWPAVLTAAFAVMLSYLLISRVDGRTLMGEEMFSEGWWDKCFPLYFLSWVIVTVMVGLMWGADMRLLTLNKQERTSYLYSLLVKEGENYERTFSRLEAMKTKQHPYFYAIAKVKLHKRDEASKYFQTYADSLPAEKKLVWLAFCDFFRNDFWSAEKFFEAAGQDHYALWSRFRNNQLSPLDLKQFVESHTLDNDELSFFGKMQDVVISTESLRNDLKQPQDADNITLLNRLRLLEKMVQVLEKERDTKKADGKEPSQPVYGYASYTAEMVSKLRDELNLEIEKRVIGFAVKQAPPFPIPDMAKFADSFQYMMNGWVTISAFAFFLLCFVMVSIILRDKSEEIKEFFGTLAGSIGLSSRISKLGRRSKTKTARAIVARLTKMEPEDEKGLFSEEIKRIHAAVFPVDILIGLWYHRKAKHILAAKHLKAQEREDILFIYRAIRKLSGKLIPHGDGQALGIITAMRERADIGLQNYRKGQTGFLPARDELLTVQKELVTLGDILEAFGEKPELTNYHLLGLEPKRGISDTEVKQAYRSVMSAVHPDHNPNNKFVGNLARLVIGAYATLGNPNRRAAYETAIRL